MSESFGARLRQQRERHGVALATIAETTKIKSSLLDELERGDLSHWPTGIFRRSYVRAYAQAIGLNPEPVVREFLSLYPDPAEEADAVEAIARTVEGAARRRPPTRLTYLLTSAMNALPSLRSSSPASANDRSNGEGAAGPDEQLAFDLVFPAATGGAALEMSGLALQALARDDARPAVHESIDGAVRDVTITPGAAPAASVDDSRDSDAGGFNEMSLDLHPDPSANAAAPRLTPAEPHDGDHVAPAPQVAAMRDHAPASDPTTPPLETIADLCTRVAAASSIATIVDVLADAMVLVNGIGVILWVWDADSGTLRPALCYGYPKETLTQLPAVEPAADNAIGAAFRSAQARVVSSDARSTGAIAVPLIASTGCSGVLAAEFRDAAEQRNWARTILTILAAQLATAVATSHDDHSAR